MEARALRYFQAVAELGSYSRGAEVLRISQPAISRQVRALEDELGRPLFVRHSHGVSLTEPGRTLLAHAQTILRQLDRARDDVRTGGAGLSGTLVLAVPPAAGNYLVPALQRRIAAAMPNVFLKVVAGFSRQIQDWVLRTQVDLACLHDPPPLAGFTSTPLVREEVFLVGRPGALDPSPSTIRGQDLARLPLILPGRPNASRRLLDVWLARPGRGGGGLDIRAEIDDHLIIRAMIRDGLGFSLLTRGAFHAELAAGEVQAWSLRPRAYWELALLSPAGERGSPVAREAAVLLRATARDLVRDGTWPGLLRDA